MKDSPSTCDTSVLVPALHPALAGHAECRARVATLDALTAHTLLETYRVLTGTPKLPPLPPQVVAQALEALSVDKVQLPAYQYLPLIQTMSQANRGGGAIYDAQIAATAKHHGLKLLTRDCRAASTYDLIGVEYEFVE